MVSTTPRPLYPRERPGAPVPEAGWSPGPVWTGAENLVPTGIRSPDRPARSESLYRLSYNNSNNSNNHNNNTADAVTYGVEATLVPLLGREVMYGNKRWKKMQVL